MTIKFRTALATAAVLATAVTPGAAFAAQTKTQNQNGKAAKAAPAAEVVAPEAPAVEIVAPEAPAVEVVAPEAVEVVAPELTPGL